MKDLHKAKKEMKPSLQIKTNYKSLVLIAWFIIFNVNEIKSQAILLDSLTLDTLKAVTSIEEALKHPEQVIKLELKRDKLKAIPPEVFNFVNLQYLDVSKNQLTEIPVEIGQLRNLQYLNLEKNKLERLPPQIGDLTNIYYLNVGQNELYSLPAEIGKLEN